MKRWMVGVSILLVVMGCTGDQKPDTLSFTQMDGFGNSQELIVEEEKWVTELEELVNGLEWTEMDGETQEIIYTFRFERKGETLQTYRLWRDAEVNQVKLFHEQKGAYAVLNQQKLRTLQEIRGIGEENHYKDQVEGWGE